MFASLNVNVTSVKAVEGCRSCQSWTYLKSPSTRFCPLYLSRNRLERKIELKEMTLMVLLHGPTFFPKTSEITYLMISSRLFIGISIKVISFMSLSTILLSPIPTPHLVFFVFMCPVPPLSLVSLLFLHGFTENSNRTPEVSLVTSFLASWAITQRLVASHNIRIWRILGQTLHYGGKEMRVQRGPRSNWDAQVGTEPALGHRLSRFGHPALFGIWRPG